MWIGTELHTRGAALCLHAPDLLHEVGREANDHRERERVTAGDEAECLLYRRRRRLLRSVAGGGAEGEAAARGGGTVRRRRRGKGAAVGGAAAKLRGGAAVHVRIAVALFSPPKCLR